MKIINESWKATLAKKNKQLSRLGEENHGQSKTIKSLQTKVLEQDGQIKEANEGKRELEMKNVGLAKQLLHQAGQSKNEIRQRNKTIESQKEIINEQGKNIKGKNKLLTALGILAGGVTIATGINSTVPEGTQYLPDLTPNTPPHELTVDINPVQLTPVPEEGLTINDLKDIRDTLFEPVTVKEGQGYSQVLQEQLGSKIKELGLKPDSLELKGVYRLMDTFTKALDSNSSFAADTNINNIDLGSPDGSKVYVPKNAFALQLILEKLKTVKDPAPEN